MSEAIAEGYRAVDKHRFGVKLIGFTVLTVLAIWAAHHFLGDKIGGNGRAALWVLIAMMWIVRCVRSIIAPEREAEERDRSLRAIRVENILFLILWTTIAAVNAWEIVTIRSPGVVS